MSNWSSVIVLFSGIDQQAAPDEETTHGEARAARIARHTDEQCGALAGYHISPGGLCNRSLGSACEVVLLMHVNHFSVTPLISYLRSLQWDLPDQVELLWKDENDEQYHHWRMVDTMRGPATDREANSGDAVL